MSLADGATKQQCRMMDFYFRKPPLSSAVVCSAAVLQRRVGDANFDHRLF